MKTKIKDLQLKIKNIDEDIYNTKKQIEKSEIEIQLLNKRREELIDELMQRQSSKEFEFKSLERLEDMLLKDNPNRNLNQIRKMIFHLDKTLSQLDYEIDTISKSEIIEEIRRGYGIIDYGLIDIVYSFLLEDKILIPMFAFVCDNCINTVATFRYKPTQDELSDFLYEQYFCNQCKKEIDHNTSVDTLQTMQLYRISKEEDK